MPACAVACGQKLVETVFFFWKSGQFCGSDFGSRFLATTMGVKSSCGQRFSSWNLLCHLPVMCFSEVFSGESDFYRDFPFVSSKNSNYLVFLVLIVSAANQILESQFQISRFVVLSEPAADEILELQFIRRMVFAGPASDTFSYCRLSGWCTEPAADEILELNFVKLMVFAESACDRIFVLQIVSFF